MKVKRGDWRLGTYFLKHNTPQLCHSEVRGNFALGRDLDEKYFVFWGLGTYAEFPSRKLSGQAVVGMTVGVIGYWVLTQGSLVPRDDMGVMTKKV